MAVSLLLRSMGLLLCLQGKTSQTKMSYPDDNNFDPPRRATAPAIQQRLSTCPCSKTLKGHGRSCFGWGDLLVSVAGYDVCLLLGGPYLFMTGKREWKFCSINFTFYYSFGGKNTVCTLQKYGIRIADFWVGSTGVWYRNTTPVEFPG